jgi:AcrR family transcriptional regulator
MNSSIVPEAGSCPTSADRLLDAAERLVVARGASHLTLDAVAQEAGVSKGGLLYHFPSKAALLEGMVRRHISDLEQRADRHAAAAASGHGPPSPACKVAGRLRALLDKGETHREMGAAMLAAAAGNPALMDPCRKSYRQVVDEMAKCPQSFERAAVLHLAVDGLLMSDLLNLSPFTAEERRRVVEHMLNQVREWSGQR